jgi:hypothetical protein
MATFDPKVTDFTNPVAPNLPLAPNDYNRQFQDQFENILRLYFNQLDNSFSSLLGPTGGKYLKFPYGAFSSDQDQTTTANTATLMTLNTTDFSNGVSISSSKITVANAGIYNLQFSVQLENLDNAPQDVYIWLKQGNDGGASTDITGSTGLVGMPARKNPGDPFHAIYGWNYFLSMQVNDYVQIYWSTTSTNVSIQYYAASGTPTKPSTQSVVATLSFVSRLPS